MLTQPGYFADGGNLYFRVAPSGARGWIFRFALGGRTRDMGLGAYPEISLAAARKLAEKFRRLIQEGVDPIEHRRTERAAQRVASAKVLTFDECARAFIADHESAWRNAKHRAQWSSTLNRYASPVFGKIPAAAIDVALVTRALKPIWHKKTETASRLRGRIESVLDWARVHGYRGGENPARWKGNLDHLLPSKAKVRRVNHHAALPYTEIGPFMANLRERQDAAARALEFTILTAARTSEAVGAHRSEINVREKVWIVPAERMKAGRDHRVPLCQRALAIVNAAVTSAQGVFLFAGRKSGQPLSNMAMLKLLERMGRDDLTVHGFRSTFRDWAGERTNYPNHVVEMALAHAIGDKVEAAYRRGDLFEKRRRLMAAWAEYCAISANGELVPLHSRIL
ncbi:MAG: integrase arm-type DNA-binding domain-containing protein [Xanthobacteraceae bacterium]